MKKSNLFPVLFSAATLLSSCMVHEPISTHAPKNNKTYRVDFLFEYDGCKVYRFEDQDNYVYFTNCGNETTAIVNDSTFIKSVSDKLPSKLANK